MKWEGNRESDNVEDQRGQGSGGGGGGFGGGKIGIGAIVLAALGYFVFGINPMTTLGLVGGGSAPTAQQTQQAPVNRPPANDRETKFVRTILADTEDVWTEIFAANNAVYPKPKLTLFEGGVRTACGKGESAMGPFYCPGDKHVYLDLGFFREMTTRFKAPGEFAQAYVIAHEIGHHIQKVLGTSDKVDALRGKISEAEMNALSVRLELQADCFAGVWAHHANKKRSILEAGDVEKALRAATAIGDDALQKAARGYVVPESFTHGSSEQRVRWFSQGLQTGAVQACDTFKKGVRL